MVTQLQDIARFPVLGDNAVIALSDLKKGTLLQSGEQQFELKHDVLTGHRFAAKTIAKGEFITSWRYPFGRAARDIEAGEYLCNANVLFRLSIQEDPRFTSLQLPKEPNFTDDIDEYCFDESAWTAPAAVERYGDDRTFLGFDRGGRGTGTRNHLVILGTSSATAPLVERLEAKFKERTKVLDTVDAVVGLRHTEGTEADPEERDRTLRTLAGLISNPNVGGLVSIESGLEGELSNQELEAWMRANGIPVDDMRIHWITSTQSFSKDLNAASVEVEALLERMSLDTRTERSVGELRIGLQCGASDAFSGVCGNVLSGAIAREVIRYGGSANLTETPELSGAEDYTLSSIVEPGIATRFLSMLSRFKEHLGWHGGKVDKNPSEGNLLGGLYNITLKSLGAAVKRDPEIPIRHIIEYSERMDEPGYYFMDGMGGDIASYTGQAASGCNVILFVTGRGSPTNSSIVPTVKIVNTTERYKLMADDIDINAGRYLDGLPMDELTALSIDQVVEIASGERTLGEKRNQNIDLIWRKRFFGAKPEKEAESYPSQLEGRAISVDCSAAEPIEIVFDGVQGADRVLPRERIGLILPTVGCSVATAEQAAAKLNAGELVRSGRIDRFVTLTNTEGCGTTTGAEILNFILSYADHSKVDAAAFVSLGCEMVSPGFIKSTMRGGDVGFPEVSLSAKARGYDPSNYGWLTIQECGGTEGTVDSVGEWFGETLERRGALAAAEGGSKDFTLGVTAIGPVDDGAAKRFASFIKGLLAAGGTVVIAESSSLLRSEVFCSELGLGGVGANLTFAQRPSARGLHVMQCITENAIETVTGLGAVSDVILNFSASRVSPAHSLVPTLNVTDVEAGEDFDGTLESDLGELLAAVLSNRLLPKQNEIGHTGNQIPRGARAHAI
ncbi:UxaA family hydrolase [Pelagicoccus mobilis]|uniref:UxaA family hydrolase n=1 Tax=Pelagicoccus mobilis TaxID=415221 RepID=A0A934S0S1_9BACT|nr:UxaA family hydrolase [Pelagicoccus mobilis]MBK1879808.1 UxaA family hydrolase [Pelagicoccus mobilis]